MGPDRRYKHADLTGKVIKTFYEVYNELGFGFLESVCRESLRLALADDGLTAETEQALTVWFRNRPVGQFRADLIVEKQVLVELKSGKGLDTAHEAQVLNYLRATTLEVGLLLNFGPTPQVRRFAYDNARKTFLNPR